MSLPTLSRRWGAMQTLAGLSLILTLFTGEGVTECGGTLCGYRAVCFTSGQCQCSSNNDVLKEIKDTSPSLWYCLESCTSFNTSCPMNTTCTETDKNFRSCTCSSAATRSSTGQCLGDTTELTKPTSEVDNQVEEDPNETKGASSKPTASVGPATITTRDPSIDAQSDCNALTVGLAVGFGEALCLVVIFVVVVLIRKHRHMKAGETCGSQGSVLRSTNSNGNVSSGETQNSYENAVNSSSSVEDRTNQRADPRVEIEMDMPDPDLRPRVAVNSPAYEPMRAPPQSPTDNDSSGMYESTNVAESPEDRLYTTLRQT